MSEKCKVVYGSTACGFKDVTEPQTYEECVNYLREHRDEIVNDDNDGDYDPHYGVGLDIINVETGRLMSWVIR